MCEYVWQSLLGYPQCKLPLWSTLSLTLLARGFGFPSAKILRHLRAEDKAQ